MKLYEYIDKCFIELGIEKVFGVPGSLIMPIWQGITKAEVILCSHEQEASYLATGYSKMSRKPVAVITTGGPGVTNCVSGVASANIDSIPLIYISGRTPICENGLGLKQEESHYNRMYESTKILTNFTKKSVCIDNIYIATRLIKSTMLDALRGRQGAVHISVPIDIQKLDVLEKTTISRVSRTISNSDEITKFSLTNRPLFIIGWGCWLSNSFSDIYELAKKINAPTLVTSKAYCCIEYMNPLYIGKLGYGNNQVIDQFIKWYNPDSIVAFGSSLGKKDLDGSILSELINKVDTYIVTNEFNRRMIEKEQFKIVLTSDIKKFISMLSNKTTTQNRNIQLLSRIIDMKNRTKKYWEDRIENRDDMAKAISVLNEKCDERIVVTADAGNHLANVGAIFVPKTSGAMFLDVGLRAMGTGICTAVGMAIADNKKTYIAVTGDGSMLMNGNVLHVAKERNLPVVFIVFNNNTLGRVRIGQSIMNDYRATDILNVNFQYYGRSFGLQTYYFTSISEFEKNIDSIIYEHKTSLVEILTNHDEIPLSVKGNLF